MSIRKIIEDATKGDWIVDLAPDTRWPRYDIVNDNFDPIIFGYDDRGCCTINEAKFIATFNPEHVALMEAVINTIDKDISVDVHKMARKKLEDYRKERGLND